MHARRPPLGPRGPRGAGGRPAGRQQPGLALTCFVPGSPGALPWQACPARLAACRRPGAHPVPTRVPTGCPHLLGPGLPAGVLLKPRAPGHVLRCRRLPHPAARAASLAPCQPPGSPARAGGRGAAVPGEGEAPMPGRPAGPPPSPSPGRQTARRAVCENGPGGAQPQQSPVFIWFAHSVSGRLCAQGFTHGARPVPGRPRPAPAAPGGDGVSPAAHIHVSTAAR